MIVVTRLSMKYGVRRDAVIGRVHMRYTVIRNVAVSHLVLVS